MTRILLVGDLGLKHFGGVPNTFERKLFYGLIRNRYCAYEFSDKDMRKFLAPLHISRLGARAMIRALERCIDNFRPELLLTSNAMKVPNATLAALRDRHPQLRIASYTNDGLFVTASFQHQQQRLQVCDHLFVTGKGPGYDALWKLAPGRVHFIPNPVDPSVEYLANFEREDLPVDLLFCGTGNADEPRTQLIQRLQQRLGDIRFVVYGMLGREVIRGRKYYEVLRQTRMALNINREEHDLYTSDRLAQLMGNGILCFIHADSGLQQLLGSDGAVFFRDEDDLVDQVRRLAADDTQRRAIARTGAQFYLQRLSAELVSRYMVERSLDREFSRDYAWTGIQDTGTGPAA